MHNIGKPIIMAVDDKPELLASISEMLKGSYDVICVTSSAAALKAITMHTPQLFILDIEMPEIDGLQLAKILRNYRLHERTPIIFLTGRSGRGDVVAAISNGGNDYIVKPVQKELLEEKIRKLLV